MSKKLCFATNNGHKLQEISGLVGTTWEILSLKDIGCFDELPENKNTLEGNSLEKAQFVYNKFKINCFADDTGLEVDALGGSPGVYSARYAGEERSDTANINLLLKNLQKKEIRTARFRTVITLIEDGKITQFEGTVKGEIIDTQRGTNGFGYDPVFIPEGFDKTFAEMDLSDKNKISHRSRAISKLVDYLCGK